MSIAAKQAPKAVNTNEQPFEVKGKLKAAITSEIVIALCGPIGSPLHKVSNLMKEVLSEKFKYDCSIIRLSDFIKDKMNLQQESNAFRKVDALISAGNDMRRDYGLGVLAELAVHEIRMKREDRKALTSPDRVCHIIDSIKNQEELDVLKHVYRDMVYTVGVFSSVNSRETNLRERGMSNVEISSLIDRDSGEEIKHGQTVRQTFPLSDFFLCADSGTDTQVKSKVERFLSLALGVDMITPTIHETAMYSAACAASNSACLSRQVGAALTSDNGELLSVGWNDVPKAGGNLYIYDPKDAQRENDKRCWNLDGGKCFNDEGKKDLANDISKVLADAGVVKSDKAAAIAESILERSRLKGLIEFSRAIHAEMHAILNAGKLNGSKILNGKLFVTTYPCHSCARHIIAAGISEVYFIEPYRKSLAVHLHGDAITEEETRSEKMVKILPYDGVAPSKFLSLFKMTENSRKKDGKMLRIKSEDAVPRFEKSLEAVPTLESIIVTDLLNKKLVGSGETDDKTA